MALSLHPLSGRKGSGGGRGEGTRGTGKEFFETDETRKDTACRRPRVRLLAGAGTDVEASPGKDKKREKRILQDIITMKSLILAQDER